MKTFLPNVQKIERKWYVVDADGMVLGRLATRIASILRGKHKAEYTPHLDVGDHVVVLNAEKIRVTGSKEKMKNYTRYTGYPGGLRVVQFEKAKREHPERIIKHAIKGMLPHNPLGRSMFRKLKVYKGTVHPHKAQQPQPLAL